MCALGKLCSIVKKLNMNDDKTENCCSISTYFIRKFTDFFFIIIGEKSSSNIPLRKIYRLRKIAKLTFLYVPMYLQLDDYPPFSNISDCTKLLCLEI